MHLEKLLPKDNKDNKLEWVHKDSSTFLALVSNRGNKITGIKRWDQAFHIYETFHCGANPHRAREIRQYVDVIHTAANAYCWDYVYNYDVIFRHLMEFNPARSWAVTYNHMWNLSHKEPLTKNGYVKSNSFNGHSHGNGHNNQSHTQASTSFSSSNNKNNSNYNNKSGNAQRRRPIYCWSFNCGEPCKFGNSCKYIEHCNYCDSGSHGVIDCHKLKKKTSGNSRRNINQSNQQPLRPPPSASTGSSSN